MNINTPTSVLVEYHNRYREVIKFAKKGNIIEMSGYDNYLGISGTTDDIYSVDPSGGPFINVGHDMGMIDPKFKGLIVEKIEFGEKCVKLKTKQK